jgi:hypothetical protein
MWLLSATLLTIAVITWSFVLAGGEDEPEGV